MVFDVLIALNTQELSKEIPNVEVMFAITNQLFKQMEHVGYV